MRRRYPTTFIYALIDPETDLIRYIGKANDPISRLKDHLFDIDDRKVKTHKACWLRKLNRHGLLPVLKVLEEVSKVDWIARERYWIEVHKETLTNSTSGGEGMTDPTPALRKRLSESHKGYNPTPETRRKISESQIGKVLSEEHKEKIRIANTGKTLPQEQRDKISRSQLGKIVSPEVGLKISAAKKGKPGIPRSAETRDKISQNNGMKNCPDVRLKVSQSLTGHITTQETREKISKANSGAGNGMHGKCGELSPSFGTVRSEEVKQKLAEAQRLVWEKRRAGLIPERGGYFAKSV